MVAPRFAVRSEHSPIPARGVWRPLPAAWRFQGGSVDPQVIVSFASRGLCHSGHEIHCGLTVIASGRVPETIAATDDVPVRVDWLQYELGQGPVVEPALGEVVASRNLATEERWRDFGKLCVAVMDLRSMVSIRIPLPAPSRAMLNLYSRGAAAFDRMDVDAGLRLGRFASAPLASLMADYAGAFRVDGDSSVVALALGTVAACERVAPSEAFHMLLEESHSLDRPLLELACQIAADGWMPQIASTRGRADRDQRGSPSVPPTRVLRPRSEDQA